MTFETFMISCRARGVTRGATLAGLRAAGWDVPLTVVLDEESGRTPIERIHLTWRRVLDCAAASAAAFVLLVEDDIVVGRWFTQNLLAWPPLAQVPPGHAFFGSLYNPALAYYASRPDERCLIADPRRAWGAQALVMTPATARFIAAHWNERAENPDIRMPRLASRVTPIYLHLPSLVDHAGVPTTWGGFSHRAFDFDPEWRGAAVTQEGSIAPARP
jgi:hypothetical protein